MGVKDSKLNEPLLNEKKELIKLQLKALSLGISPLEGSGYSKKLNLDREVKIAMRNKWREKREDAFTFTFRRQEGGRYFKQPKSKKLLEKQISTPTTATRPTQKLKLSFGCYCK